MSGIHRFGATEYVEVYRIQQREVDGYQPHQRRLSDTEARAQPNVACSERDKFLSCESYLGVKPWNSVDKTILRGAR
ncbi:hypothetical protein H310_15121 [Aphanomyces invadans]|uniref:Uncharacterized protein n=1 Tax=Aphanomyces invadans TaxID=157072 RepID=A0A024T7Y7_9STRA|nr:hypothetical protein H310_15121 [Aphanomyces invadans]ETV90048.1 hypothetical protein H310_15121 [Aphanomyces invadans]|eukprot:XP_008881320.1 hypothetical protein H310_15121 [Aphanomyces invadans]